MLYTMVQNFENIYSKEKCHKCHTAGVFTHTTSGGDAIVCPFCRKFLYDDMIDYEDNYDQYYSLEHHTSEYIICDNCLIPFQMGCDHAIEGCSDNIFNAHIISQWFDHDIDKLYIGTPKFDNLDEFINANIEILELICPNRLIPPCPNAYYTAIKNKYEKCRLTKNFV
jgi:hypothetical protein